ncbi:hypothetical protein T03_5033 [Trichinella britovi]|uniref:Uncharacterized protein n=1 Tax=Trichinella britovi TaxID=45882 RepID=A0A0V1CGD8_TRIBR|nr:hypothetical protein T03_5033 [Trichinella britovi]
MYQQIINTRGEWPMGVDSGNLGRVAVRAVNGKLTELKLPQFSGEVLEFPTFWAHRGIITHSVSLATPKHGIIRKSMFIAMPFV